VRWVRVGCRRQLGLPETSQFNSVGCVAALFTRLHYDGIVILDVPDSISVATLSVTVGSTGAFKNLQTHELLTQEQLGQAL